MTDFLVDANDRKVKSIWAACDNLSIIIDKMKNCSESSKDDAPELANNTIIIGNDEEYLRNINEIEK
jgi:hypothetical protein